MTGRFTTLFAIGLAVAFAGTEVQAQGALRVSMTSPADEARVPWRPCVAGTVSDPAAHIFLVIHDKTGGDFFVQPGPVSTKSNGTWSALPYIAEDKPGVFENLQFEIKAFGNPKTALEEGQILANWPEAEAVSELIDVTRHDDAPSGCEETAGVLPATSSRPSTRGARSSLPVTSGRGLTAGSDAWNDMREWLVALGVILFFFVMAALLAIQETGFPQKLADLLTRPLERVLTACARILQPAFDSLKGWLKKAAVPEPEQVLSGCLLLGVGVAACICNYQQMAWALALLLPVETGARLIAFVLVAMAGAIGFMLHTSGSKATKAFAWALFLALMCMEGRIAYQRTVETERLEQQDRAIQVARVQGAGQLTIDAADVADSQPIGNGTRKALDPGPAVSNLSPTGLQAGLLAVLLAAAVAGCFWGGYTQGGGAVARGVALSALAVIGLPLALLTVVNESRWADKLNPVLAGIFMGFAKAAARTAQAVRDVAAYFSTASRHSRKFRKIQRQVELEAMEAFRRMEAEARLRIDEAGLDLLAQRNRDIIETLAREYEGFPVRVLREVLENLRPAIITTVTPRASRAITDSVSDVVERLCVNGAVVRHQAGPEVSKAVIQ